MKKKTYVWGIFAIMYAMILSVAFSSCGGDDSSDDPKDPDGPKPTATLTLSGLDAPFDAEAGSIQSAQELKITCSGDAVWSISGKPEWLDISALSGTGTSTIKVWTNSDNNSTSERTATLVVTCGNVTKEKIVTQRAGYDSDLEVSPNTIVTLANGYAFDFVFGKNVKYYYVKRYLPKEIDRKTDNEIIKEISSDDSNRDTPSDNYVISWANQNPLTEYVVCMVGYDSNGNHGALYKTSIKTMNGSNQAAAYISDVKANESEWKWTTTVNPYVTRYYMWFNSNSNLYDTPDAGMAWFLKRNISRYPDDFLPIAQGGNWTIDRDGGNVFDVVTWALDVDGNFSGIIDRFTGSVNSSSRCASVFDSADPGKWYKTYFE